MICNLTFCILDFSVNALVDRAWILGENILHEKRTKRILRSPKITCLHTCFFRNLSIAFLPLTVTSSSPSLFPPQMSQMHKDRFLLASSALKNKKIALIRLHRSL